MQDYVIELELLNLQHFNRVGREGDSTRSLIVDSSPSNSLDMPTLAPNAASKRTNLLPRTKNTARTKTLPRTKNIGGQIRCPTNNSARMNTRIISMRLYK
jgi:hypothetical protein